MTFPTPPYHRDVFQPTLDGRFVVDEQWHDFFRAFSDALNAGKTVTVVLAKIGGTGQNGSLTLTNGIVTDVTQPT